MTNRSEYVVIDPDGISSSTISEETIDSAFYGVKEIQYLEGAENNHVIVRTQNLATVNITDLNKFKELNGVSSLTIGICGLGDLGVGLGYYLMFDKK